MAAMIARLTDGLSRRAFVLLAALLAVANATQQVYGRKLVLNVSGVIPAVLLDAGFPLAALKGVPLVARTVSLIAHLLEETVNPIGFILAHAAEAAIAFSGTKDIAQC